MKVFSNNLKRIRRGTDISEISEEYRNKLPKKSGKLTQENMAELLNVVTKTYASYEQDVREPSLSTVVRIAEILGVSSTDSLLK